MHTHRLRAAAGLSSEGLTFVGGRAILAAATASPSFALTSLTGGAATEPAAGDVVIACVAFKNATNRDITCVTSGYTELADAYSNSQQDGQLGVFYKVLVSAETSVTFNIQTTAISSFATHVWRNVNATPLDTTTTVSTMTGIPDAPSITTVTNDAVVIAVGAEAGGNPPLDLATPTVPSGMENFFQVNDDDQIAIGIASIARPTAGAYNPPAFGGFNSDANLGACAATIALRSV